MIVDDQLELSMWDAHVGPDIGGVEPTSYGWRDHPLDPPVREFYVQGPKYSDWLAACHRPVLPNTGKLGLQFELFVDQNSQSVAQAIEIDTKLAIAGQMYNFSSQFNYATGIWQVSDFVGSWVNTPCKFLKFRPSRRYDMAFDYVFDTAKKAYAFVRMSGPDFAFVGPMLPPLLASPTTWKDSCSLQVQQDLAGNGGAYSIYLRNIRYVWS